MSIPSYRIPVSILFFRIPASILPYQCRLPNQGLSAFVHIISDAWNTYSFRIVDVTPIVKPKVSNVALATLIKGGKITFADAITKLTGIPAKSRPEPIHTSNQVAYLEDLNRRIVK